MNVVIVLIVSQTTFCLTDNQCLLSTKGENCWENISFPGYHLETKSIYYMNATIFLCLVYVQISNKGWGKPIISCLS